MAQVKIYGLRQCLDGRKREVSDAIHEALVSAFSLPQEKRFHRFLLLERDEFLFPPDRSENYTVLEISVFEGRSPEAKKTLIRTLFRLFAERLGIGC